MKSTFGYSLRGTNPFLEMADLVIAETTCDGKKKMFELMGDDSVRAKASAATVMAMESDLAGSSRKLAELVV